MVLGRDTAKIKVGVAEFRTHIGCGFELPVLQEETRLFAGLMFDMSGTQMAATATCRRSRTLVFQWLAPAGGTPLASPMGLEPRCHRGNTMKLGIGLIPPRLLAEV